MRILRKLFCCWILLYGAVVCAKEVQCNIESAEVASIEILDHLQTLLGQHPTTKPHIIISTRSQGLVTTESAELYGYYDRATRTIHVACKAGNRDILAIALGHEVTHHYLNEAFGRLPLWLEEGLATYMEVRPDQTEKQTLPINPERLNEFVNLLKFGHAPALSEILARTPDIRLNKPSQYYAAYWAFVFALMHHPDAAAQKNRRHLLLDLLEKSGDVTTVNTHLIDGLLDDGISLAEWEQSWHKQIWDLRK